MIQTKTIALATVVVVGAIGIAIAGTILAHQALALPPHGDENSHPQEPSLPQKVTAGRTDNDCCEVEPGVEACGTGCGE